jgi:hypothetical protein
VIVEGRVEATGSLFTVQRVVARVGSREMSDISFTCSRVEALFAADELRRPDLRNTEPRDRHSHFEAGGLTPTEPLSMPHVVERSNYSLKQHVPSQEMLFLLCTYSIQR